MRNSLTCVSDRNKSLFVVSKLFALASIQHSDEIDLLDS